MTKTPTRAAPGPAAKPAAKAAAKPAGARTKAAARTKAEMIPAEPVPAAPVTEAAEAGAEAGAARTLRKKELVERVVAASGAKRKIAKQIVEATLQVLGEALAAGEQLVLPPFGNAHKTREKDTPSGGSTMTVRLRRAGAKKAGAEGEETGKEALADPAE
ncbi:HU family DNA-binding protein [Frigidibacter mobilis]|uniref:DNA-binding protein HU n=1 Tax=Frigidibacter mobilis TaxID=1335048 RepID=A0A159Z1Z7_9RHOB|nr:HU family DNA-binding protein [Frigidibacter mobilis]AMY69027.1 DNA-binding protein HU [Frigidibacter mobilis]